jgi:hypothetical protein
MVDVFMIAMIVGGAGLSAAYVIAEYRSWREQGAALQRREASFRSLHAARLAAPGEELLFPSVHRLQGFGAGQAANPDSSEFSERRKRQRAAR